MYRADDDEVAERVYRYIFTFPTGQRREFTVRLDGQTMKLQMDDRATRPRWTDLSFNKCPNCPLDEAESPACPAALSLVGVAELFGQATSFDQVDVCVESASRNYVKTTTMQRALSSLMGLYMVTSGCPVLGKLRPLVWDHLPLARLEETEFRIISMYLLAQYVVARSGGRPDWELKELVEVYREITTVNKHFSQRLSALGSGDASRNAVIILDTFANIISFSVERDQFNDLQALFAPYLPAQRPPQEERPPQSDRPV